MLSLAAFILEHRYVRDIFRHQDIRRVQRLHRHRQRQRSDTSSSNSCESSASSHCDREPPEIDRAHFSGRSSLKQSFLAKVFSGIIGYGVQYELFQFVYDLWLWTTVGSAKQKSSVPLRITLSGRPYSPEYWKRKHAGLLDLQRQLGYPTLFLTIAPYEWSFPYHVWVRDELDKAFRNRLHLPAAETLHAAHVMSQTVTNYICGFTQSHKWTHHVLRNEFNAGNVVVSYFLRIEFQDGKRKRHVRGVPRSYHGRGTPHIHALIWLKEVQTSTLRSAVSATMQNLDTPMRSIVRGSQCSYTGSGWPVRTEDNDWDVARKILLLRHESSDHEQGVRAYMPDVLSALRCHMDVSLSDGRGMLLRYCAGYVPKFSSSFATDWLNDEASASAVTRRILDDYHPLEPEMWLQLAAKEIP